jgi:hypothetical protein
MKMGTRGCADVAGKGAHRMRSTPNSPRLAQTGSSRRRRGGAKTDRKALARALAALQPGDV